MNKYYIVNAIDGVPIAKNVIRGVSIDENTAAIITNCECDGDEITSEQYFLYDPSPKVKQTPAELQGKMLASITLEVAKINAKLSGGM